MSGIRLVEFAGLGPGPFACMLLADFGADIVRIERIEPSDNGQAIDPRAQISARGRRSIALNLRTPEGIAIARRLVAEADGLIEGFRPGTMERLGLGPDDCLRINPRLVYGRVTGWGQDGPLSRSAAHDINFISVAGALHAIGPREGPPSVPLALLGDFAGGALYLALGVVAALLEARSSGQGQVVDAAIIDGVTSLMTTVHSQMAAGIWSDTRGSNLADGSCPWNTIYLTRDDLYISIGTFEARFYRNLLTTIDAPPALLDVQNDRSKWPELRRSLARIFRTKSRAEWCALLDGSDTCFAPVLAPGEAGNHPHIKERQSLVEKDGTIQSAPAPRFSRTAAEIGAPPSLPGAHSSSILAGLGFSEEEIAALGKSGVIAQAEPA